MSKTSVSPTDLTSEANVLSYIINSAISKLWTSTLVKVTDVDIVNKRLAVLPLVQQIDNDNKGIPGVSILDVPYFVLQGGKYAVDISPAVGDIGICLFGMRDISNVKTEKEESLPGTFREYAPQDAMYIGGILNSTPEVIIKLSDEKIEITAPQVVINGDVSVSGNVSASDVIFDGISAKNHIHIYDGDKRTSKPEL